MRSARLFIEGSPTRGASRGDDGFTGNKEGPHRGDPGLLEFFGDVGEFMQIMDNVEGMLTVQYPQLPQLLWTAMPATASPQHRGPSDHIARRTLCLTLLFDAGGRFPMPVDDATRRQLAAMTC